MLLRFLKGLLKPARATLDKKTLHALSAAEHLATEGDVAGALRKCQDISPCFISHPEVLVQRAGYLAQASRLEESEVSLKQALAMTINHPRGLFLLGSIYLTRGEVVRALPLLAQAEACGPPDEALLANYGVALRATGNREGARKRFEAALERSPKFMAAAVPLCQMLIEAKEFDAALSMLERLLVDCPNEGRLLRLKGFILYKHYFQAEEADGVLAQAEQQGESEPQFWNERGECARDLGDGTRALRYFQKALALSPGHPVVTFNVALLELMLEKYETAWPGYETRFDGSNQGGMHLPAPKWEGGALRGAHLAILGEQGIGDEIMFASCVQDLPTDGVVTLSCTKKLLGIFQASFPKINCIVRDTVQADGFNDVDLAIAAGSLPGIFRNRKDAFPRQPYLRAPTESRLSVAEFLVGLPGGLKVGISWRGGTEMSRLRLRSIPLDVLANLLKIEDVNWVNFQYGECSSDLETLQNLTGRHIHHSPDILADYAKTAALAESMDIIVSVCTAVIHLGGALGKEVYVLAPKVPEWRYGLNFGFMPWYRQVEVFRQTQRGDWDIPILRARQKIQKAIDNL